MRHQYGISALVSRTSFGGENSGSVPKCRLFSQDSTVENLNGNLRYEQRNRLKFCTAKAWLHGCVVTQLEKEGNTVEPR